MEIKGVSAIVTGGASGIGAATVRLLAKGGAKVVIADLERQKDQAEALIAEPDADLSGLAARVSELAHRFPIYPELDQPGPGA